MVQWYYMANEQEYGPCGIETIKKLLADGALTPDTLVCDQSIGDLIGTRLMKPMNWTKHCIV